jgi:glycosyltransferase involved in cell wall biosynthesis
MLSDRPKSILVMLYPNVPHPGLIDRVEAIENSGRYEVHTIYWHRGASRLTHPFSSKLPADRFHPISIPDPRGNPIRRAMLSVLFAPKLRGHLRRLKPDVIMPVNVDMLGISWMAGFPFSKTPVVYDMQDIMGERLPFYYRIFYRLLLRKARAVLVQSPRFISAYVEPNGLVNEDTPVVSIPNAVAGWDYVHDSHKDSSHITIGYFGNLRGSTEIDMLITTVEAAQESGRDIRISFAGAGPQAERVAGLAKTKSFIKLRGVYDYLEERDELYGSADLIYAVYPQDLPNNRFHIARRFQESVHLGIPIVVAGGSYMADITKESGVGWSVNSQRPDELKNLLYRLYDDRSLLKECTEASRSVRHEYEFETYAPLLLEILDRYSRKSN